MTTIVPLFFNPKNNSPQTVGSLHFTLPYYIIYTREVRVRIKAFKIPLKSVKILGTLYSLLAQQSQCWCTRFGELTAINEQHWEEEEIGKNEKKNSVQWKCPNYFCLRLQYTRLTNFNLNLI